MILLPNLLFVLRFVIDITFAIIAVLPLLLQALNLLFYATTLNLFLQNHFLTQKTLPLRESTIFSQRSSISSYNQTGHLFSRPTSQNSSILSSDIHLLNINLNTDQYSTLPTPNRVDYPLIVNNTLVNSPRQDPRFLYLATHKLNSNPHISDARRRKEFLRLEDTNLELKFEITVKFHNLSPHPIPSHTTFRFKSLPHPFIATNFSLFVSDNPPFRLLHGSITFLNTLTYLKYTAQL